MASYEQEQSDSPDQLVELTSLMEVEFLRGSAWYKAFLVDYETDSQQAVIAFGGQMNRDQQVPLKFLRYPPSPSTSPVNLQEKGPVEALAPAAEGEPEGWWKGKIAKMKGEFYVVEFDSQGALFTDIFEGHKVRTPNPNQPFSEKSFNIYRTAIEVPLDLHVFCSKDVHASFSRSIGALSVSYRRDQNLLVFLAKSESVIQCANLLSDMHMRNLRTKMNLEQRANEGERNNPTTGPLPTYSGLSHEATFRVEPDLLGLAIGRQGGNVTNARNLSGIQRIDLDEGTCTFHIIGDTDTIVDEARKKLEFIDIKIEVPRKSIGRLIGKKGSLIQEIVDKSGVVKVKIEGDDTSQPRNQLSPEDKVPFHFIGRKENVETARIMMDYQMAHIRDLDKFISEHDDIPPPPMRGPNPGGPYPRDDEQGYRGVQSYGSRGDGYRRGDRDGDRFYSGYRGEPREPREHREPREPREPREHKEPREPREPREPKSPREPRESKEPKEPREPKDPKEPKSPNGEDKPDEDQPSVRVQDRPVNTNRRQGGPETRQQMGRTYARYPDRDREQRNGGGGDRRRRSEYFEGSYDNERRRPFRENRGDYQDRGRDRDFQERRGDNQERRGDYQERRDRTDYQERRERAPNRDRPDFVERRDRPDLPERKERGVENRDRDREERRAGDRERYNNNNQNRRNRGNRRRDPGGRSGRRPQNDQDEPREDDNQDPTQAKDETQKESGGEEGNGAATPPPEPRSPPAEDAVENGPEIPDPGEQNDWASPGDESDPTPVGGEETSVAPLKSAADSELVNGTEKLTMNDPADS